MMSFQEISAWLVLVALSWTGFKFGKPLLEARSFEVGGGEQMITFVIGFVILLVMLHVAVGIIRRQSDDDAEDERDRDYDLRADQVGSYALATVAVGALFYALHHEAIVYANILFLGLVLSEIVKRLYQVYLYRSGA